MLTVAEIVMPHGTLPTDAAGASDVMEPLLCGESNVPRVSYVTIIVMWRRAFVAMRYEERFMRIIMRDIVAPLLCDASNVPRTNYVRNHCHVTS